MTHVDDLFDVARLWEAVRKGTGAGIKVAILDTGVDTEHPALEGSVASAHAVVASGQSLSCRPCTDGDSVGHGTACAGIIHSIAPEAELHSLRVIGRDASGTLEQLSFGLRWAIEQDVQIINLSLGSVQKRMVAHLHELVDQAFYNGQILVAAANNLSRVCYPAHFASLIAVDNQSFDNPLDFHYRLGNPVEIVANGIYVNAPSPGGQFRLYTGTSFACPHITGLVARLCSEIAGITPFHIRPLLWQLRSNREAEAASGSDGVGQE